MFLAESGGRRRDEVLSINLQFFGKRSSERLHVLLKSLCKSKALAREIQDAWKEDKGITGSNWVWKEAMLVQVLLSITSSQTWEQIWQEYVLKNDHFRAEQFRVTVVNCNIYYPPLWGHVKVWFYVFNRILSGRAPQRVWKPFLSSQLITKELQTVRDWGEICVTMMTIMRWWQMVTMYIQLVFCFLNLTCKVMDHLLFAACNFHYVQLRKAKKALCVPLRKMQCKTSLGQQSEAWFAQN